VKPTVGFTLPWAGVTPAPGIKKRCGTSSLLELVWSGSDHWQVAFLSVQCFFVSLRLCIIQSEAKNPESFLHLDRDAGDEAK
jgi:hypothetical protein